MASTTEESQNSEAVDTFKATRNYTSPDEKIEWRYFARWSKDWKYYYGTCYNNILSEELRTRRKTISQWFTSYKALRLRCEKSNEIGAFIKLTNSYCLLCGEKGSEQFLGTIKGDLTSEMPVINSSIAGCKMVGCLCVGNNKGLLLPDTVYDTELKQIKEELPDSVQVKVVEETLSALGNVIVCNDKVALIHPEVNKETEEIIADTLQVEVFRHMIGKNPLVGAYCVLNNHGGLVSNDIDNNDLENISSLLELPLVAGTVNSGSKIVSAGLCTNDCIAYAGMKTTSNEFSVIESIFQLKR